MTVSSADIVVVMQRYHELLHAHREDLNRLNVYPVPDGDTGDNMVATMDSVVAALEGVAGMEQVAAAVSRGSLMGGAGNSGVILSQLLRGFAEVAGPLTRLGPAELARGLANGSETAYRAVLQPVEGTILTVARAAAAAADASFDCIADQVAAAHEAAIEALEETPQQLAVLASAGVVDAGGAGYVLLTAALAETLGAETARLPDAIYRGADRRVPDPGEGADGPRYEVMFFLDAPEGLVEDMLAQWEAIGDSIVVVGGSDTYNCHIHTNEAGRAIEAGIAAGRIFDIRVSDLQAEGAMEAFHHGGGASVHFEPLDEVAQAAVGVVPVGAGRGVIAMFRALGAQGLAVGGQTMNPSVGDLVAVIDGIRAATAIVLPNNKNVVAVAEQAATVSAKRVFVVPTRTVPQGLAAMVAYRSDEPDPEELAAVMAHAAGEVRSGEVTRAVRDAETPIGPIAEGSWIGIADGEVVVAEADAAAVLTSLLGSIVDPTMELVTLIAGAEAEPDIIAAAVAWLDEHRPGAEAEVVEGDQPIYPYLVSAE